MATTASPDRVVVRRRMNDHGTMTVERCATTGTRYVRAYATAGLRRLGRRRATPGVAVTPAVRAGWRSF